MRRAANFGGTIAISVFMRCVFNACNIWKHVQIIEMLIEILNQFFWLEQMKNNNNDNNENIKHDRMNEEKQQNNCQWNA